MKKKIILFSSIFIILFVAVYWSQRSQNRFLASDSSSPTFELNQFNLGSPSSDELIRRIKYRVISELKISKFENSEIQIKLGHFTYTNSIGNTIIGCELYNSILIEFQADGVSYSGFIPKLSLNFACTTDNNPELISSELMELSILFQNSTNYYFTEKISNTTVFAQTAPGESWPSIWQINKIKLYNDQTRDELIIEGFEIPSVLKNIPTLQ